MTHFGRNLFQAEAKVDSWVSMVSRLVCSILTLIMSLLVSSVDVPVRSGRQKLYISGDTMQGDEF
jgi:hypothetical protein